MKLPKNEKIWVEHITFKGKHYYITSKESENVGTYFIYEVINDNEVNKLGKGKNPLELETKYIK